MQFKISSVIRMAFLSTGSATAVALGLGMRSANAQNFIWNNPNSGNWSVGSNWAGGVPPTSSNTTGLTFNSANGGVPYTATNNIASPFTLNALTLNNANSTGGAGLVTLAGSALAFAGSNPTITMSGTGDATVGNTITDASDSTMNLTGTGLLTLANATFGGATSLIGSGNGVSATIGASSGSTVAFNGTVTGTSATQTNVSVSGAGTVNFNGITTLNPITPGTSDHLGGGFFATNGTVNINNTFTANNLFYVGDSIKSITNFDQGLGTTAVGTNSAILNITNGQITENGRFSVGAFSGDKGVVNISGTSTAVFVNNGDATDPNYFGGRLQIGGYNTTDGATAFNTTADGAEVNVSNHGNLSVKNTVVLYKNGSLSATGNAVLVFAGLQDGNAVTSGIGGITLSNSSLTLQAEGGTATYSGVISGTNGTIIMDGGYTQTFAGNSTMTGTLFVEPNVNSSTIVGTVNQTGTMAASVNVSGNILNNSGTISGSSNAVSGGVLSNTGALSGAATAVSGGILTVGATGTVAGTTTISSSGSVSGTGTLSAIALNGGSISPGTSGDNTGKNAIGTLSAKSLTWNAAGTLNFDVNLSSGASDTLSLSSFFDSDVATPAANSYLFNFSPTGAFPGGTETFNLVTFPTGQTNYVASDFKETGIPTGLVGMFQFNSGDNILQYTISAALPEPSAWLMLLGGAAPLGLVAIRRARSRRNAARTPAA